MQFIHVLWLPILLSGLAVFIVSAVIWMVLPHHRKEWAGFSNEDAVMDAIRAGNPAPGLYSAPSSGGERPSPEVIAKMARGPVVFVTVMPGASMAMGGKMLKSVIFYITVGIFVAYMGTIALPSGGEYLAVFRVTGTAAFMAYVFASVPDSIWFGRPWKSWIYQALEGLLYAGLTGGIFGWLWP